MRSLDLYSLKNYEVGWRCVVPRPWVPRQASVGLRKAAAWQRCNSDGLTRGNPPEGCLGVDQGDDFIRLQWLIQGRLSSIRWLRGACCRCCRRLGAVRGRDRSDG